MGTLAVGGVTGWVAVSQELLGLCVIWLPCACLPRLSHTRLRLWAALLGRRCCFQELRADDGEVRGPGLQVPGSANKQGDFGCVPSLPVEK